MSGDNTLNLPVVQMGHVEKLVEVAQNQPHVQQLVAQQTIAKELRKKDSQVPATEKSEENRRVRDRDDDDRPDKQGKKKQGGSPNEDGSCPDDEASASESPWVGNIVNVKI